MCKINDNSDFNSIIIEKGSFFFEKEINFLIKARTRFLLGGKFTIDFFFINFS